METKEDIRRKYRILRDSVPAEKRRELDVRIYENVIRHPAYIQAKQIYAYVSVGSEADTYALLAHAWSCGKRVAVPKVLSKEEMGFFYIESMEELTVGKWGIPEPEEKNPVDGTPALVVMPQLVFDSAFHRIGYGGGYYDRFLAAHPQHETMALAYSMQQAESIPAERVDICPKIIVTDEQIYEMRGEE